MFFVRLFIFSFMYGSVGIFSTMNILMEIFMESMQLAKLFLLRKEQNLFYFTSPHRKFALGERHTTGNWKWMFACDIRLLYYMINIQIRLFHSDVGTGMTKIYSIWVYNHTRCSYLSRLKMCFLYQLNCNFPYFH